MNSHVEAVADQVTPATLQRVITALRSIDGVRPKALHASDHLIADAGLDSFQFVDLTLALELAFGIDRFPMQEWVDSCKAAQAPLTIGALASACQELLGGSAI